MDQINQNMRKLISQFIDINDDEWAHFYSMLRFKEIRKNEVLLCKGSSTKDIYFVINGILRTYFANENGEEKTFHFSLENTFAADYESFLKGSESRYSIEALEDSYVAILSIDGLRDAYKTITQGERLGRVIAEEYFFIWSDCIQDIYMLKPIERYKNMRRQFPDLLQRVPQHYIASYLNITPVHLSRLKKSDL